MEVFNKETGEIEKFLDGEDIIALSSLIEEIKDKKEKLEKKITNTEEELEYTQKRLAVLEKLYEKKDLQYRLF